jgi:phospho-N-acetylmuramoyl-pentapeptide-transferase
LLCILSLLISTIYGKRIIKFLQKQQVGETIRDLGLEGQQEKAGNPNHGRIHNYHLATIIPVVLIAKLENIYIILLLITTYGWVLLVL